MSDEVLHLQRPGYCYLMLFKEQYHKAFKWPAFPTWVQIIGWDEMLREEGHFEITKAPAGALACGEKGKQE